MNALFSSTTGPRRRGFSMTELMVVVAIIAVLAGILLAAMSGVRTRALATQTESTMQEFSKACETFQLDQNGLYPGVLPEHVLANTGGAIPPLSGMENALLHLIGGYRVVSDVVTSPDFGTFGSCGDPALICPNLSGAPGGWDLKVRINELGTGPTINGAPYAPYFTPTEKQLAPVKGQMDASGMMCCGQFDPSCDLCLPDLVDAWGNPILYLRRARATGPLVPDVGNPGLLPQFYFAPLTPYTESTQLGASAKDQTDPGAGSVLAGPDADRNRALAQVLRHAAFGEPDDVFGGTAQGAFAVISAGPDGIYFSKHDGPGTPDEPIGSGGMTFDFFIERGPGIVKEFDDVRVFGGG